MDIESELHMLDWKWFLFSAQHIYVNSTGKNYMTITCSSKWSQFGENTLE